MGFLTAWMFTLYSPVVTGPLLAYFGFILEGELKSNYNITFPWWAFTLIALPLITALAVAGIQLSVKTIVILGALEFLIVLALGLSGLIHPGPGGFTFQSFNPDFNPGGIATASGFSLAVVFTVQGLTGWEGAVPLAEETENPRRNISIATMLSILIIGLMIVIVIWGQVVGWGVNNLSKLVSSEELPALVLGHKLWGGVWILVLLAIGTSVLGASLATQNVATRMWYRIAKSGALPAAVGRVHPTRKTPTVAIAIQFVISAILGLGLAAIFGPQKIFIMVIGFVLVISVILIYVTANVGVTVYFWRNHRRRFNWLLHFIFPIGTSVVLIYSLIKSFTPFPASPYNWSPAVVGGWLVAGILLLVYLRVAGKEEWIAKAGAIVGEHQETALERETLHDHRV
jgi:amino acid transporter